MHKNNSNNSTTRERERRPIALQKLKDVYSQWLAFYKNFPKVERFGVGQKIERGFLDALELIFIASFSAPEQKIPLLARAISRLDVMKFFIQLAWETKLLTAAQYALLLESLEEVGRMLGGWRKGLVARKETPAGAGEIR